MTAHQSTGATSMFPLLRAERVTLRPGTADDVAALRAILSEPSVMRWWGNPEPEAEIARMLAGQDGEYRLVIEATDTSPSTVVGAIQYSEEEQPDYRHAGIDIFLSTAAQGRGLGGQAVRLIARFLIEQRGHHRLVIDPAVANERAIRCYAGVGFRPVGVMRQYERGLDGSFHDGLLMDLLAADLTYAPK